MGAGCPAGERRGEIADTTAVRVADGEIVEPSKQQATVLS